MKSVLILNDPPYGTERVYNGLRLAHALMKNDTEAQITVFLMADAVLAAKAGQKTPEGFYNVERMLKRDCRQGPSASVRHMPRRARDSRSGDHARRQPEHDGRTGSRDHRCRQSPGVLT
jgi:sulfur relay (sulfurtransferase) complex TusBCD TusD component (DsrE family)